MMEPTACRKLVAEVEKRPCIYNTTIPAYVCKYKVDEAWDEIGAVLNEEPAKCKEKWRNIRTVFLRFVKDNASRSGSRKRAKKPYYLGEQLRFILPFLKSNVVDITIAGADNFEFHNANTQQSALSEPESEEEMERTLPKRRRSRRGNRKTHKMQQRTRSRKAPASSSDAEEDEAEGTADLGSLTDEEDVVVEETALEPKYEVSNVPERAEVSAGNNCDIGATEQQTANSTAQQSVPHPIQVLNQNSSDGNVELVLNAHKFFLESLLPDLMRMSDREIRQFKRKVLDCIDEIFDGRTERYTASASTSSQAATVAAKRRLT